ncbi:hypothetical protein [Sphingomonas sp.]|uniref:hypothetical protein n=1 Tax=Sphingomonas sp. TaxID=28214 RepID=UPI003AFFABFA
MAAATVAVSFGISLFMDLRVWPFVLIVTAVIVTVIGTPLLALLIRSRRPTVLAILGGGFVTGAVVPLVVAILGPPAGEASVGGVPTIVNGSYTGAGWIEVMTTVGLFGLTGVAGAALTWVLAHWLASPDHRRGDRRAAIVAVLIAAVTGIAFITPWLLADRSCHNPLRDGGTSIGPVASLDLDLPQRDWPVLDRELRLFARQRGWNVQADSQPVTAMPWFQQSLCVEPGTQIMVMNNTPERRALSVSVFQPQGGDSWQAPLRALQRRIESRWPHSTSYRYDAFASPRPPWAPSAPTPAPSSTAR